jgi:DNA polymerase elongation subunit (family B)
MENEEKSIDGIKDIIQNYLDNIRSYEVDIDDLIITASLAKSYKNENLPHVFLANKLRQRKEEVQVGDRIPYVFIEDSTNSTKKFERAEDPKYAKEHNLKVDRLSYLDQVVKPILGLLKIVLKKHPREYNFVLDKINETFVLCHGKPLREKDLLEVDEL